MKAKCEECGGKIVRKTIDYSLYGQKLGRFPADVCQKCGETLFDEETFEKIENAAKQKNLWGLEAKTKIGQVGTTLDIRLTQRIIRFLGLKKGEEVTVRPIDKHRIVVEI